MIIQFRVMAKGGDSREAWNEEIDTEAGICEGEGLKPAEYAQQIINFFNSTLGAGETERELCGAKQISEFSEIKI